MPKKKDHIYTIGDIVIVKSSRTITHLYGNAYKQLGRPAVIVEYGTAGTMTYYYKTIGVKYTYNWYEEDLILIGHICLDEEFYINPALLKKAKDFILNT
jgi:hypothetical protein